MIYISHKINNNDKWHGRFKEYSVAKEFAQNLENRDIGNLGYCKPES